ncbi:MAG: sensor histidine kinase [Methanospirillum sp.]|nr:sensor histidine kinase [Methanospirillum sp.]
MMPDVAEQDKKRTWELLLDPGVCWIVREEEGSLLFSPVVTAIQETPDPAGYESFERVFPPDISFLLTGILHDSADMHPGDDRAMLLSIPGDSRVWSGHITKLVTGQFLLVWYESGKVKSSPEIPGFDEQIRSERAVRKANEKLNYFNAVIRHDITNLVMGIVGYLDILDEICEDEEARLLIRKSRNLGERVRRVAELTRSYQDLGIRPPSFIEAEPVINRIISRHEFSGKVTAEVTLENLSLYVDRMFDVIIYELIRNSLQFGGAGVRMRFSYELTGEGLLLVIEDSGPGIAPEMKEQIFARNYADRKGYGLYLASEILDITGVTIRERGTFGSGARFELMFPPDTFRFSE